EDTFDEHVVRNAYYNMEFFEDGKPVTKEILMRNAMNEVLRDWYVGDCAAGVVRWNKVLERHGISDRLRLPDRKFNRHIGMYSGFHFDPNGVPVSKEEFDRRKFEWLPSPADSEYLLSIMAQPIYEPGKFANYIAPPRRGINQLPINFEYVRTQQSYTLEVATPFAASRRRAFPDRISSRSLGLISARFTDAIVGPSVATGPLSLPNRIRSAPNTFAASAMPRGPRPLWPVSR